MSNKTKIEWAEATLNPYTGCTPVSAGCANCYAAVQHARLRDNFKVEKYNHDFLIERRFHPHELEKFARKKKPRLVFVGSMADWLHHDQLEHARTMAQFCRDNPQHFYLFLTKRADDLVYVVQFFKGMEDHVGFGVTIENQDAMWRATHLALCGWKGLKFASCEPLLGPVDFGRSLGPIHWVITGCESGNGRRPMQDTWYQQLQRDCADHYDAENNVAFMLKQKEIDGKIVKAPLPGCLEYPQQILNWRKKHAND